VAAAAAASASIVLCLREQQCFPFVVPPWSGVAV
jgi:hypothetical protein